MINLFRGIALSRTFQEDLATDGLYYFLQHTPPQLRKKLRVGFASLWSSIPGQALTIDRYETRIAGQASGGRPDITGYTGFEPEVVTLLVENKFGAPRTRMQANLDYLCDLDEGGLLLFIVPDNRRGEFYSFIRAAPDLAVGPDAQGIDPENSVRWQKTQDNKVIAVAGWQVVIRALESGISDKESATSEHTQIDDELKDYDGSAGGGLQWNSTNRFQVPT